MSVGPQGIPRWSVFIRAFAHVAGRLQVPRVLVTPHLMGRTIGAVGDRRGRREVVEAALRLATAWQGCAHVRDLVHDDVPLGEDQVPGEGEDVAVEAHHPLASQNMVP